MSKINEAQVHIVVLRDIKEKGDWSHLQARLDGKGDLLIEGQDLGTMVSKVFGEDFSEYEWVTTIKKKDIHLLIAALDGNQDDRFEHPVRQPYPGLPFNSKR